MAGTTATTTRTIDLDRQQTVTLEGHHGCIRVVHGLAWLTEAGDAHDSFLAVGDAWRLSGQPLVLGALAPARVEIVGSAGAGRASALVHGWQALVRAARRQVQRLQLGPVGTPPWAG